MIAPRLGVPRGTSPAKTANARPTCEYCGRPIEVGEEHAIVAYDPVVQEPVVKCRVIPEAPSLPADDPSPLMGGAGIVTPPTRSEE